MSPEARPTTAARPIAGPPTGTAVAPTDRVFASVALLLFSSGWAANHFASMLPVLRAQQHLTSVFVNAAFGIYAIGLLPGLLSGGGLADRIGPRRVVVTGAATAAAGNLLMACWHAEPGILTGRLVVGVGVGLAVSAGTAWAANLRGVSGATFAGIILTAGFATGPIASGLLALRLSPAARLTVPFLITALLSALAVGVAVRTVTPGPSAPAPSRPPLSSPAARGQAPRPPRPARGSGLGRSLAAALPMALWVFSSATVSFVVLPGRMHVPAAYASVLPGLAAGLAFSAGVGMQVLARRRAWGPFAGVAGAVLAGVGFTLVGAGGQAPAWWLSLVAIIVLGSAYGLCLREGLVDVDLLAPPASRGLAIGVFYVFTYLGFGLPVFLETVRPSLGPSLPLFVLAAVALAAAAIRTVHVLATDHLDR
ncbi:MFS transporter [Raineyella sp.]|uniref:MFS transporter n=1 Tax=Raineyella sp. TaxID=1911550 RepID=UPI002B21C899|nr:MFS transporter [Raineyella sp.]MEA5155865.1 MFS transporter [Raineyella sp.]